MAQPPTPEGPTRRRRWPVVVGVLVLGLVGYFVVAPLVQTAVLRVQLPMETDSARASALPAADAAHAAWLPEVSATLGLRGDPVYSASYDICYVDHDDSGWFATNYNQNCQLSYVDFYELATPNRAVEAAVEDARNSASGARTSGLVFVADYLKAGGRNPRETPSDMPIGVWATLPGATDARAATDSWMLAFDGVVAYAMADAYAGRELLAETGDPSLDPAGQYLVVADTRPYFHRNIGCAIGRPVFCSSPLGDD